MNRGERTKKQKADATPFAWTHYELILLLYSARRTGAPSESPARESLVKLALTPEHGMRNPSVLRKPGPWSRWLCIVRKYCLPAQDSIAHRRYNVRLPSQQIVPAGAHLSIRRHRVDIRARVLRLGKPGGA